ncbi:MAG TPA: 2'-5' RNA ligase family protein [Alphaproteobacteria bacterium]|nr:2'-5' RNA ligase family protein [Alphaproteobacteria bacterium]
MDLEPPRPKWPAKTLAPGSNSLFFAVLPEPDVAERIEALASKLRAGQGLSGRLIPASRLHVTATPIADYAALLEYDVSAAMQAAAAVKSKPFDIAFNRMQSFGRPGGNQPLVLRCGDGLGAFGQLQKALLAALRANDYDGKAPAAYTPHITLLYDRRAVDETFLDEPIGWTVREFALVYSVYGEGRHMHLGRWPLTG